MSVNFLNFNIIFVKKFMIKFSIEELETFNFQQINTNLKTYKHVYSLTYKCLLLHITYLNNYK